MKMRRILSITVVLLLCIYGAGNAESWNFAVFGDTRDSDGDPGVNSAVVTAIATDIVTNRDCAFALVVGDTIHGEYDVAPLTLDDQFQAYKDAIAAGGMKVGGSVGGGVPNYPVRGNHETINTFYGTDAVAAWQIAFDTLPQNGPDTASGGGGSSEVGMTYSFINDNALILGMDEYVNTAHEVNQAWIDTQLTGSTGHVFAFGHEPAYQAVHDDCLADEQVARDAFLTSLYNANGRIYFAGHDHMTALARVYEKSPASGGSQKFYQLIIGGGGAPQYDFNGVYNSGAAHAGDYAVTDVYHDSDSAASIPYHYAYAVVTINDDLVWLKLYGTESLTPVDWQLLYSLVVAGTMQVDTSTLTGDIGNDSNITFTQTTDGTYAGVISGIGTLNKEGDGKLILSGDNTYTGDTSVNDGILSVTGNSGSTAVTVNAGAVLMGTGTVKSLTNHGTVRPGSSVGTLNLAGGAFTQGADGTLEIEVESTASYDKIIGASTASLDGTLTTITSGSFRSGDTLTGVIETAGGITGAFARLNTRITPTLYWRSEIIANTLNLVATSDYNNEALLPYLTQNELSLSFVLDSVLPSATGDLVTIRTALDSLPSYTQVAEAYGEITPQKLSGMSTLALNAAEVQVGGLNSAMQARRSGETQRVEDGRTMPDYSYNDGGTYIPDEWWKDVPLPEEVGSFIKASTNFGKQDATENQPGYNYFVNGITGGVDYRMSDTVIIGLWGGYARTDSSLGGSGGKADANSMLCGLYSEYYNKGFYIDSAGSFTGHFYDTERKIEFAGVHRTAEGSTFGKQFNAYCATGYDFQEEGVTTGPLVTASYAKLWIDDFSETGAGALNMHIAEQEVDSLRTGLGWRLGYETQVGMQHLSPQVYASFQHEFLNRNRSIDARLSDGGGLFQIKTDKPARNFALLGCGVTAELSSSVNLLLGYEVQVGQRKYTSHRIDAKATISY